MVSFKFLISQNNKTIFLELRSLVELIGPYGIDYLTDKIMWHIASQVAELKVKFSEVKFLVTILCFDS